MNLCQSALTQEELTGMGEEAEISHSSRSAGLQSCLSLLSHGAFRASNPDISLATTQSA